MSELEKIYGDDLLMVFDKDKLNDRGYEKMAVIRNGVMKKDIDGILVMNYEEDFESLLNCKIPTKTRKPAKLLSLQKTYDVLDRMTYGVIASVIDGLPYNYQINYVFMDGHIYFHTGRKGYKLNGLNQTASFVLTEDLGMSYNGTHNFRSVQVLGTLKENCDYEIKKKILNLYIDKLNPNHPPYIDAMQDTTLVYEIEIDYMMGRENLYLE